MWDDSIFELISVSRAMKLAACCRDQPITVRDPSAERRRSKPQKSPPGRATDQICELCSARVAYSVLSYLLQIKYFLIIKYEGNRASPGRPVRKPDRS